MACIDWFHKTESKRFAEERPAACYEPDMPVGATLAEILEAGYAQGIPRGSARGGCFEIQTSEGIWSSPTGNRLGMVPGKATFKSWDQLDAEEA